MFRDVGRALQAYGQALRLSSELRLWRYYWIPALISVLLAGLIGFAAYGWSENIGGWITGWYPWEWGSVVVEKIGQVMGGLMVLALGFILYKNLVMILAGPFMSPLSVKVETHLTGHKVGNGFSASQFASDMVRGIRLGLRNIIRELFLTILFLLLGLVVVLAPISAVGIFLIQSYYAGFGNMDYALERHFRLKGSVSFVRRSRGLALGNGIVFMGLLLTGLGFLIAPPLSTVAATIVTVKRLEKEDRPI
ncbi:MAG: EI24 domain-containing protein [Bacteroidetes bacterium]|nr:EI24 domain-containing protein [Bacteroidota bacterium]